MVESPPEVRRPTSLRHRLAYCGLLLAGLSLLLELAAAAPAARLGEPYFETVAGTDSLANGIVTAVTEDARGLIWFGTTEGLASFDGYRLRRYRHQPDQPDSLGDDYIRALLPTPDGRLWVATQGAGLSIYDPRSDRFERLQHDPDDPGSLPSNAVVSLAAGVDGAVWFGLGFDGLAMRDGRSGAITRYRHDPADPRSLSHDTARALLVDRRGDLWVGTGNGLNRLRRGESQFERIAADPGDPNSLAGNYVYALYEASDGRIWLGTQTHGAAVLDPISGQLTHYRAGGDGLSHPWIDGFVEPSPGRLWVATFGAGIDEIDPASGRVLRRIRSDPSMPGSLALDRIVSPLRDRAGLIWLGVWGGGLQWHNPHNAEAFQVIRHSPVRADGLGHRSVLSLLEQPDGLLWIGTDGAGIDVLDRQRGIVERIRAQPEVAGALGDGTVRAMARSRDGSTFVGTQQSGLFRFDPDTRQFARVRLGAQDARVTHLLAGGAGELWVAAQRGLARLDPASGEFTYLGLADGSVFQDPVWGMAEDAEGTLWVGTPNALLRRRRGENALQPAPPGSPRAIMDIALRSNGELWTIGPMGLHRSVGWVDGWPTLQPWGRELQALDASYGRQLRVDAEDRLWTPRFLIEPEQQRVTAYGRADGAEIGNVDIGARITTKDGVLAFGGTRGLLLVDPERFRRWQFAPTVLLTAVEIDGVEQSLAGLDAGLQLQPAQRRLSIEFAALDYARHDETRYAYRLTGLDQEWIETDARRRLISYNNLWPGDYQLQVRAAAPGSDWSPHLLSVPLKVLPAWWQSVWFALAAVLGLFALGYAGSTLRTRRVRRQAAELQATIEQRTAELREAKQRAERTLDELRGTQKQLVDAEKMASLGQLVAGVAHEINTPIGIAVTAASHLDDASRSAAAKLVDGKLTRRDLQDWQATVGEGARLVLGSLERARDLIGSFKRVAVDQSSEQRRRFAMDEFLGEVRTSLMPSFRRSPHTLEIDCPPRLELDTYPGALFQIVTNLANNAVLHAFAEGQSGRMRIEVSAQDERVQIRFSDDGIGMPEAVAARAFDPFFTTRRGSGGSGLGLHLVYNLTTQLLGGSIELHSQPGQGTEFRIEIPAVAPEATSVSTAD